MANLINQNALNQLDLTNKTDAELRELVPILAQALGDPNAVEQNFGAGLGGPLIGQELAQIGQPNLGGPALANPTLGQQLGAPPVAPQVGPRMQPLPAQGFLPGPPAGPVASPQFPQLPPAQGPGSPLPGVNNPAAIPQDTGIGVPPPQQQGPDIGSLLNALSAVQPVAPPPVPRPPGGQTNVGSAALAQNLIAQLFGGGAGAPLPIRLTG